MERDDLPTDWDYEDAVDEFFERLVDVTVPETRAMIAAWGATDAAERTAAWALVRSETKTAKRQSALDEARDAVLRWAGDAVSSLEGSPYSITFGDDLQRRESRNEALPPVIDAAAATIVRDRIPADVFDVLYGPWALGIEPVAEEDEEGDEAEGDEAEDSEDDAESFDDEEPRDDGEEEDGEDDDEGAAPDRR